MRFQFTGEFQKLNRFRARVQKAPTALETLNENLAEETIGVLIADGFRRSEDPYGKPWAPPKLRDGNPLEDTGGLKGAWFRLFASRSGFGVANAKQYAQWHQGGTGIFGPRRRRIRATRAKALKLPGGIFATSVAGSPQRKMVPDEGLPQRWRDHYVDTAQETLTELFR